MSALQAVSLYAGLNLLLIFFLSVVVVMNRRRAKVSLGSGGDKGLEQASRAHANCIEYALPGLAGLTLLALQDASMLGLHALGMGLTLGRFLHAYGLLTKSGASLGRQIGILLNWMVLVFMSGWLLGIAIS